MGRKRRRHGAGFKAKVALEALRMQATVQELGVRFGIHPQQVTQWKRQAVEGLEEIFSARRALDRQAGEADQARRFEELGRLKVELDGLKKKLGSASSALRGLVEPDHPRRSVARQCELLGLARSSFYYEAAWETAEHLKLLRRLDEQYTQRPC